MGSHAGRPSAVGGRDLQPEHRLTPSLLVLLLANALPIAGVLFLGWTVFPLVLLYWLENVVVGGFNVAKLLFAQPREPAYWAGKLFLIPLFVLHFGAFTFVHGVLLVALLGPKDTQPFNILAMIPAGICANHLDWAVVGLVVSHGLSFYWNYIMNGEYQRASRRPTFARTRPSGANSEPCRPSSFRDIFGILLRVGDPCAGFSSPMLTRSM
ncbi:MAG TPA: DUF6498-containing protein [Gemmatimonadales bacterium]|jgi:hypothetical protein|nr:DUF6498-containing protein [Gemmatimonadales bacterium]